jgi:signal transduction histidine kinase
MAEKIKSRSAIVYRGYLIVSLFVTIILLLVFLFTFQSDALVAMRVYVGGEGLWAKAQKDAVRSLEHYAFSHDEADYQAYLSLIDVPLGDQSARLELQKPDPDLDIVREGYRRGRIHPVDIEYAIPFFRRFQHTEYMSRVIEHWAKGDQLIEELRRVAGALHEEIASGRAKPGTIRSTLDRLNVVNQQVAEEENLFSSTLAEASRRANSFSKKLIYSIAFLFTVLGVVLSWSIITRIRATEGTLIDVQDELIRKEKLAILGQLSGSVGHELRNPLGVMSNAVYYLKTVMSGPDETVKEYLNIIKSEIDNSERIISDLLDFTRTKTPRTKVMTVNELIKQGLGKCAVPTNVSLRVEIPDTLSVVRVDPLQLGQVFHNLVTNAVQAMPEGGELRISARKGIRSQGLGIGGENLNPNPQQPTPDRDFIEISITDTGEGITQENMKKLFQPLFTTKAKGIGLGLTVVKNLVEANSGRIEVQSETGKGTTFAVMLPIVNRERG